MRALFLIMLAGCGRPLEVACFNSSTISCEWPVVGCEVLADGGVDSFSVGTGDAGDNRCWDNSRPR